MSKNELLRRVQEADFILYDVSLFLDTHPTNQMALDFFHEYQNYYTEVVSDYEMNYGPLVSFDADTRKGWTWVQTPWPWEMED